MGLLPGEESNANKLRLTLRVKFPRFGQIVSQIILNWKEVTRGTDGVVNIPRPMIGGWTVASGADFYYLIAALVALLTFVAYRIRASRYGRAFVAIQSDALAAEVSGLNVFGVKWIAFVLSGVYAGIGGSVYAHMFSFISPEAFELIVSINVLAMVLVGGSARVWGVLVGSAIITGLPELLRFTREYYMMIYGLGMAAAVVFVPGGISGYVDRRRSESNSMMQEKGAAFPETRRSSELAP